MASYTPTRFRIPTSYDEVGLKYSMARLPKEDLSAYRRRLLLEARDSVDPSEGSYVRSVNRKVGLFEKPVFDVGLVLDGDGAPLAADPYIEVTSTHLRAYSDKDGDVVDFMVDFTDRDNGWFLTAVHTALDSSPYFSVDVLDIDYEFLRSDHLRYGNTEKIARIPRLQERYVNDLGVRHIKNFYPQAAALFLNEKDSADDLVEDGDYYVDYVEGVLFSHSLQAGYVSLAYREFPHRLWWQPVRACPVHNADFQHYIKQPLVDEDGLERPLLLNSRGAQLYDKVLEVHSLGWGA